MDDLEFVKRCIKGEKDAWEEFVKRYSRLIYNYVHSILKIKGKTFQNSHQINDIFQEIFVILTQDNFKKLKTYQGKNGCSLASWLRQVVINFTIDYLRKAQPTISLEEEIEQDFKIKDTLADDTDIEEILVSEEKLNTLKDCIKNLNTDDKYFLELYLNQNLSLEELKLALGVSRGTVDMRKSRIIKRLRDCFRDKGFVLDF